MGHWLFTALNPHFWGPIEKVPKRPNLTGDTPKPSSRNWGLCTAPQPGSHAPSQPSLTSAHLQALQAPSWVPSGPPSPLLRAGEVLSQALYSYQRGAVINSQRLAAATRGGRFCPPATLQRQGLISLKHTRQPFHGDPFQFHGARTALTGKAKKGLFMGVHFKASPLPSQHTLRDAQSSPAPTISTGDRD